MADQSRGVSPPVAVAFAVVGYFALLVAGFGLTSLYTDTEVLAVPGLGPLPGVLGVAFSTVAVVVALWSAVRRPRPSYGAAFVAAVAALLAYLIGVGLGAVIGGSDAATALAAVGGFATSWFALILAALAFVAGWAGIALVRTRASRPRWPWERDEQP